MLDYCTDEEGGNADLPFPPKWRVWELHPIGEAYETSLSTGPPAMRAKPTQKGHAGMRPRMALALVWFHAR